MADTVSADARKPPWWTAEHTSDWDRVKEALKRDWEQTKADFSMKSGENLNQNVGDTVMQAAGAEPLPARGVKNRTSDPEASPREAERARVNAERESVKAAATSAKARDEIARQRTVLGEQVNLAQTELAKEQDAADEMKAAAKLKAEARVAEARDRAAGGIAKERAKIGLANHRREEAISKWKDAEEVVRYGYSVRSQYPATYVWDDKLEGHLRGEWERLEPGMSWRISRSAIRRGWDFADQKR